MIIEWLLDRVLDFVTSFFELFDDLEIPEWLTPSGQIASFFGNFYSVGVWIPWAVMGAVVSAVVVTYVVTFLVKVVKQILAHIPAFGGAG